MREIPYEKGMVEVGENVFCFFQPNGGWGLSNAGLVVHNDSAVLVDTFYDLAHTGELLNGIETVMPEGGSIRYLVNTHANGDHWYGNCLIDGVRIVSTDACAREMRNMPPRKMNTLLKLSWLLGKGGKHAKQAFKEFDYGKLSNRYPDETFCGKMSLDIDGLEVQLIEVGPAHTKGDAIVYIPERKVVFASDILFVDCTPVIWEGPMSNIIRACDDLMRLDAEVFVPGHGPATDRDGVQKAKGYFEYIYQEGIGRLKAGMSLMETALEIDLGAYSSWIDSERLIANLYCIYKELYPEEKPLSNLAVFKLMRQFEDNRR